MQEDSSNIDTTNEIKTNGAGSANPVTDSPSYLIPGSIVIAGLLIAIAVFTSGGGGGPATNDLPFTKLGQSVAAAEADADVLACEFERPYDQKIDEHINDAVTITGGQIGTPWTVVHDTETDQYYVLGGAYPYEQINSLIDNNFAELETEISTEALSEVNPVTDQDYYRGSADARYVFIEYSDYDCPYCGRFHDSMKQLLDNRDDVAWVYRHLPLEQIHPQARGVANVAECVGEDGQNSEAFWLFTDAYFNL